MGMDLVRATCPRTEKRALEMMQDILRDHPTFKRRPHPTVNLATVLSREERVFLIDQVTKRGWPLKKSFDKNDDRPTSKVSEFVEHLKLGF
jgi:hypothetical protein